MIRLSLALGFLGCGGSASETTTSLTWHADVSPIVQQRCASCHQEGAFAPFALTTYEEVTTFAVAVEGAVRSGSMPPWKPVDECADYVGNFDLTEAERETLLAWLDGGMPEGDPEDAPPVESPPEDTFRADLTLALPEPYTPVTEPDDYRCQLVDPGLTEPTWVTGLRVFPDQESIVHHTIVFVAPAEQLELYQQFDEAEAGPGYTCFGGPTGASADFEGLREWLSTLSPALLAQLAQGELPDDLEPPPAIAGIGAQWLGSWVPGTPSNPFPEGTGVRLNPGDQLVVQMHYNTLSATPVADRSSVALMLADEVEKPAVLVPFTDLGWVTGVELLGGAMTIPAGESEVTLSTESGGNGIILASTRDRLGLAPDAELLVHSVGLHLHQLGRAGEISVTAADGSESCLLAIDDWDFGWQGNYDLAEPVPLAVDDTVRLSCTWDNSAENQAIVDGEPLEPRDVSWGEGTTDEMCLSTLYVTER